MHLTILYHTKHLVLDDPLHYYIVLLVSQITLYQYSFQAPPLFANPVYGVTSGDNLLKSHEEIEADLYRRQNMLAASSTDDITLISKKKVTKTHSSDIPQGNPSFFGKGSSLPHNMRKIKLSQFSHQPLKSLSPPGRGHTPPTPAVTSSFVPATDIDSGETVLVSNDSTNAVSNHHHPPPSRSHDPSHMSPPSSSKRTPVLKKSAQVPAFSKSFDTAFPLVAPPPSNSRRGRRQSVEDFIDNTNNTRDTANVQKLKEKFEFSMSLDGYYQSSNGKQTNHHHHAGYRGGRQNSTENSDSGRESMVLESDSIIAETTTNVR